MTWKFYVLMTIFLGPVFFINGYVFTKLAIWMFTNKGKTNDF